LSDNGVFILLVGGLIGMVSAAIYCRLRKVEDRRGKKLIILSTVAGVIVAFLWFDTLGTEWLSHPDSVHLGK
jgi:hypothetical protein